ncbi:MAG: hypothetical protein R2697_03045 [Ilumatobacteraceae bacterium]
MREHGISQLPCAQTPRRSNAEVAGSVDELELMERIAADLS